MAVRDGSPVLRRFSFRAGVTAALASILTACAEAPTAPRADVAPPRANGVLMCVARHADGSAPTIMPPNGNGGCPAGFDLIVWW
jgi:hypothetical protein